MQDVNNFNGICIRLLYSPLSGILCVHLFSLNPYQNALYPHLATTSQANQAQHNQLGTQTLQSYKQLSEPKQELVKQSLH